MTRSLSQKIRFFTFISIALLTYVHGYNLRESYLTPFTVVNEPLTFTSFFEYLLSNGLLRFRIPLLFLISGYLFAMYDHRPYLQQVRSRFRTLLVPMLLWSAFGLLLTFILEQIPYTAEVVRKANLDQLGDNRPYREIGLYGVLYRWLFAPISYQLWFLTALFVYNLMYPLIRWAVVKLPYIWLPLTFSGFFFLFNIPVLDLRGLFFFSLGVWISKRNFSIEREPAWFSLGLSLIMFIGLCVVKTFMAFEMNDIDTVDDSGITGMGFVFIFLHQLAVLSGIMAMWFGADKIVAWFFRKQWFNYASGFSFFIFGFHVPLLPYLMTWGVTNLDFLPNHRLLCYLFIPVLVLVFSIWVGGVIRRSLPGAYGLLTGGRGF